MTNRLAQETSPYLQQHADNPVDWYPWGEEALRRAREEDKPILLSIGYSACHWCHVMAHESFEDATVAAVMNAHFINIKVDREERPDLDQIYQSAHAMLTRRSGGWPLTLFLTPDQTPFFGGTYFPKQPRYNLPGFTALLEQVATLYRSRRSEIDQQNASLLQAFEATQPETATQLALDATPLAHAYETLRRAYDPAHGGFGGAPKFPHPFDLAFLLRHAVRNGATEARDMVLHTLRKMADGGIHDQLGGGFCRYSVDKRWAIPHFEKMLYDNGPLLTLYADAWALSGDDAFKHVARNIAAWTMREMQAPDGGYYSSLDADSEHEEGKFYVWTREEAASLLEIEEYAVAEAVFGLDLPPNFENRHWNLLIAWPLADVARARGQPLEEIENLFASAKRKLLTAREQRVRPGRDEKILTSWNALMINGMAHAGRVLDEPGWIASARRAADFVRGTLWRDGRLLATSKDGKTHLNAYLDDHAFMLDALLELMQAEFRPEDLAFARTLADTLLARFEDERNGGFFFTSHDHEKLIHRPKPGHDNATPSGNGIAALALQRLGHLLGETRYLDAAEHTLRLYHADLAQRPSGYASLLDALQEYLAPPQTVVLRAAPGESRAWRRELSRHYWPRTLVLALEGEMDGLPAALAKPLQPGIHAWVCRGAACLPAIGDLQTLVETCRAGETG